MKLGAFPLMICCKCLIHAIHLDLVSPTSRGLEAFDMEIYYTTFMNYYNYCKGTGWQSRYIVRG